MKWCVSVLFFFMSSCTSICVCFRVWCEYGFLFILLSSSFSSVCLFLVCRFFLVFCFSLAAWLESISTASDHRRSARGSRALPEPYILLSLLSFIEINIPSAQIIRLFQVGNDRRATRTSSRVASVADRRGFFCADLSPEVHRRCIDWPAVFSLFFFFYTSYSFMGYKTIHIRSFVLLHWSLAGIATGVILVRETGSSRCAFY